MPFLAFGVALIISLILIPAIRKYCIKKGYISEPRQDRWHNTPTPSFGGIGIFSAFTLGLVVSFLINRDMVSANWGILTASFLAFILGLYDDIRSLPPTAKLIGQIGIATFVIVAGYSTNFFSPRIENQNIALLFNIVFTYFWIIGITNAINLLDNMDGLAGGIALVASLILAYFFWKENNIDFMLISLAVAGSVTGFLIYNFPPASIFMGNSGSTFLGFTLAVLAIAREPQASNVFAIFGVPTLIFLLPILDITLVTITRLLEGKSIAKGGVDHTSHRLVAFGLSERNALLVLYGIAIFAGLSAAILETINYWIGLLFVPVIVISFAIIAAYLSGLKVEDPTKEIDEPSPVSKVLINLAFRRRLLEIFLDFFLIGVLYYLAFLAYFGFSLNNQIFAVYIRTMPIIVLCTYFSFYIFGVYRSVWQFFGIDDLVRLLKAAIGSLAIIGTTLFLINTLSIDIIPREFDPGIIFLYSIFLFIGLTLSRSSFRILRIVSGRQKHTSEEPVLIFGVLEYAQLSLDWIQTNESLKYHPVGFIDDDPLLKGRVIQGLEVLGNTEDINDVIKDYKVSGIIIASEEISNDNMKRVTEISNVNGCWVRRLKLDFELIE